MIFLPQNSIIAKDKLTKYLLVKLEKDDKSKFLARAGYTIDRWTELEHDLRVQVLTKPAQFYKTTRFGDKYTIHSKIQGRNAVELNVLTIWIISDDITKFVTLIPDNGGQT